MKHLSLLLLAVLLLAACDTTDNDDRAPLVTGVFVANQGNFADANGSVTAYDPETGTVSPEAISGLNTIVQSLLLTDTTLFVIGNTSGRVDRYNPTTLQRQGAISGLISPRYMAVSGTRGFVTNLYGDAATFSGGSVSVLDLRSNTKLKDVAVGDNPEGIAISDSRVYVANNGFGAGSTVSVLDVQTGDLVETIDVACDGPRTLTVDAENEVWVFCTGRTLYDDDWSEIGQTNGAVRILEGATGRILARIDLDAPLGASSGQDAFYSGATQEMFAVLGGRRIVRFSTTSNTASGEIALPEGGASIGAVAYDATRQHLYVGRVASFTADGHVTIHRRDGRQVGRFEAGIAPTFITFREAR